MAKDHKQSIILPHCWVCGAKFVDAGGSAQREDHHVIPRAYGGTDGPEISICDSHHTVAHKIADHLTAGKSVFHLLNNTTQEQRTKLMWLATMISNAEIAMKDDPNKRATVMVTLTGVQQKRIDALKKVHPQFKSRAALIHHALDLLYARSFRD